MSAATADRRGAAAVGAPAQRADASAWLAVIAGSLGAMMATLDISIVNSSLPTIQGEIGASGTEGTWIATAYLVAEIVIIPLSAWLERVLGLRTLLLVATILFTGFSIMCGLAANLTVMIIGRVGQGFTGGALIPTAMTIIATRLPREQQPIGNALFGVTAILGPVLGPLIGGWLTENISWHYAFFLNVPVSIVLVLLLLVTMPHQKARLGELAQADWLGIAGLALGLGGLTVVLEEGQREQWFESALIVQVSIVAAIGFVSLFAGQFLARRPVIKLKLLLDRQFGAVAVMAVVIGMMLYGTSYVIPQFLASIAGYNALQSGKIVLISGIPSLMMMPFTPLLIRYVDIRIAVGVGLAVMAISCGIDTSLTAQSAGGDFVDSQLLRGVGTIMAFLFLNQAAIASVTAEDAGDAAGLFNAMRNLGGSFALAGIAIVQDQRQWLHNRRIEETIGANSEGVQDYLAALTHALGNADAALRTLAGTIQRDALVMTFNDIFWLMTVGIVCVMPLVLLLRPLPHGQSIAMH
ncbi:MULTISPECIES: MDR family MFS transporter [unclassified Sphingomonas]|uniref:MDR family MFS transporter n=1 Tax=unclassified Sphingomonas TaxID=196159 RepID=UPI0006F4E508|nr:MULTISPECIES: MDR family MFS transporter [unclassified Sphingomonas]KQX18071.1 disulfide bond formation protein DsbA [Sphingomonas sp. Root1294]KQY72626.1 disulfide bond formation protein DsbA [Sphingomonas sp. Root50]KRB87750.1 disulfide bond formation protein DsbA [Sphingomonas sp. Root720]